jgi:aspartyl protease family protein
MIMDSATLRSFLIGLFGGFALVALSSAVAVGSLRVVALFTNKAMVEIDGVSRVLVAGEPGPGGVTLISADFEEAVIEVNGQRDTYNLSDRVSGNFMAARQAEVRIPRHRSGAYMTAGEINGRRVDMMVDTGATAVALSEDEAQRLGIPYKETGKVAKVATASGTSSAWEVVLASVGVGEIRFNNVAALVVEGSSPTQVLLGMTFLGQLDMSHQDNLMILRRK